MRNDPKGSGDKIFSIRFVYGIFSMSMTWYRYEVKNNAKSKFITNYLIRLMEDNHSLGFGFFIYIYEM